MVEIWQFAGASRLAKLVFRVAWHRSDTIANVVSELTSKMETAAESFKNLEPSLRYQPGGIFERCKRDGTAEILRAVFARAEAYYRTKVGEVRSGSQKKQIGQRSGLVF